MKNYTKVFAIAIAMFGFATSSFAQADATAVASATIVTPISIVKVNDMSFGNLAVSATGGTVVLPAITGTPVRDVTGGGAGVTLPATTGTVTAASFTIGGQADYSYVVTLPGDITLTGVTPTNTMTLGDFKSSNEVGNGLVGTTLYVGGTLTVGAGQAEDVYTSDVFTVTVNYN
ncbi:DUF4402 domain-containing protein [Ancylomarina sp.]|uniref:DUF4402 domain-containing protein n=1 Tax=Ancylomarina sp. TaxID=1970196 RepID=UPI003566FC3E